VTINAQPNITSVGTLTVLSVSGNITGGNLNTGAQVIASGNITGGNLNTGAQVIATGNITGGNITTAGQVSVTGNIVGSNIEISGSIRDSSQLDLATTAGNIVLTPAAGSNVQVVANANITATTISTSTATGALVVAGGVGVAGNAYVGGLISATGNITGNFFQGNGSQLTGIDATSIQNGTSNVRVVSSGGNVSVGVGGTSNVTVFATTGQVTTGLISASGNITGANINGNGSGLSAITGANVTGTVANATFATSAGTATSATSATTAGTVTTAAQSNITSVGTLTSLAVTGNITSGNLSVSTGNVTAGNIVNSNANGVGNIGSASVYYNTIFAQATSAQYADLAEKFRADAAYEPGTVLIFGGTQEVTISAQDTDRRVAGVVSTDPSYLMNSGLNEEFSVAIALQGRVPCRVVGPVRKGDMMVSASNGHAKTHQDPPTGSIIGKSLENFDGETGTIEIVVGRD
jgi:hypothetical protein